MIIVVLSVLLPLARCGTLDSHSGNSTASRTSRSLFNPPNPPCVPRFGDILLEGFCTSYASCILNNGRKVGFCPNSNNVCCLVSIPCGGTVATRQFFFLNPQFPSTSPSTLSCSIQVRPFTKKFDQIRIELTELSLDPPDLTNGNCTNGYFQVLGGDPQYQIPLICGQNTDQHIYVNFNDANFDITLNVIRNPVNNNFGARWLISVTQINTNSSERVPEGCLQMFNGATGMRVRSFNFEGDNVHLANQFYDICLARPALNCVFTWVSRTFLISGNTPGMAIVGDVCLPDDYISFVNGFFEDGGLTLRENIYCGTTLNNVTTTFQRLRVVFNGQEPNPEPTNLRRGFDLNFFRTVCDPSA